MNSVATSPKEAAIDSDTLAERGTAVIHLHEADDLEKNLQRYSSAMDGAAEKCFSLHPAWLLALRDGLGHVPYLLEAVKDEQPVGWLPLALVRSRIFGRFLVSLPYLNTGGLATNDAGIGAALVDRAVALADELDVRYLELRQEERLDHAALKHELTSKVHMRLPLPATPEQLWEQFDPKVRNQIRKAQKQEMSVQWGQSELLDEFYAVFSRNMRDLGTPTFGRRLFQAILRQFPASAELCVVRLKNRPIAAALLIHGARVTEVPSASSLRQYNSTNANMLLYWHLLQRSIERGQNTFDFGRSSKESNTYRFKQQWGAQPHEAVWQYYLRQGSIDEMRPTSPRYQLVIQIWRRLPVWLTRLVGPILVRGIP